MDMDMVMVTDMVTGMVTDTDTDTVMVTVMVTDTVMVTVMVTDTVMATVTVMDMVTVTVTDMVTMDKIGFIMPSYHGFYWSGKGFRKLHVDAKSKCVDCG